MSWLHGPLIVGFVVGSICLYRWIDKRAEIEYQETKQLELELQIESVKCK